jgi:demethylmenaquinone methyltransferase/2-methoxy-6-polyprenyl-1,4-benzoquinol methylase
MTLTARYDIAAPGWSHKLRALGYDRAYRKFVRPWVLRQGAVLDVGTGTGSFARAWVEAGGSTDLTLLDLSPQMLRQAGQEMAAAGLACRLVLSDLDHLAPDRCFDAILAAHAMEHCLDPLAALRQLSDWLCPGGRLLLVVSRPHWCNVLIWLRFRHRWFAEA